MDEATGNTSGTVMNPLVLFFPAGGFESSPPSSSSHHFRLWPLSAGPESPLSPEPLSAITRGAVASALASVAAFFSVRRGIGLDAGPAGSASREHAARAVIVVEALAAEPGQKSVDQSALAESSESLEESAASASFGAVLQEGIEDIRIRLTLGWCGWGGRWWFGFGRGAG